MSIYDDIMAYSPCCEQEERDKAVILDFMRKNDDAFLRSNLIAHQLLSATTKWQMLEQKIFEYQHPEEVESPLYNEIFVKTVNSRPVNMEELKNTIAKMIQLVSKKNQWFCIWSVLKHHNLLASYSHEAFARQMMSPEWFGDIVSDYQRFSGDTLREYKRYFSDYDYTQWDNDAFLEQKQLYGMTKWSNSLCLKFKKQCEEMEHAIRGWRFL